ncbi:MAG: tripartite tricarboxylate transporter substrate binding protein, partial [Casimicrobiaceae bacterium]
FVVALAAALGATVVAPTASAQYPNKPIRVVVSFIAGSAPDVLARNVGERLSQRLGQPIVIENRGGAGGNIGAELAAKAAPDGYTLLLATSSHVVNPSLYSSVRYDPVRDFIPVALLIRMPSLLVVPPDSPARNVKELVALAKTKPGSLNYGSGGAGSLAHLAGAAFQRVADIEVVHVPYRGAPEIVTSLLSGQSQYAFPTFSTALPQVKAGKLRALGVTSGKRNPQLPDVPTMTEVMPTGFELEAWFGFWAPTGTPPDVVKRINTEVNAMLNDPEFRAKLASDGSEVIGGTPEAFAAYIKTEMVKWEKVVKDSGARVD